MLRRLVPLVLACGLIGTSAGPVGARAPQAEARISERVVAPAATGTLREPTRLLVRYEAAVPTAARAAARARGGVTRVGSLPLLRWEIAEPLPGEQLDDALARLRRDPAVAEVIPDLIVHPTLTPNDTHFSKQWALHNTGQAYYGSLRGEADADVDAPEAWDSTTGSASVVVAVVDTGVAYDHLDLSPNMWTNAGEIAGNGLDDDGNGFVDDVRGWDWVDGDNDPYDEEARDPETGDPHGSHVAGIIGARGGNSYGVAGIGWTTTIMPLRVLGPSGGSISDILDAMSYAVAEGADVVNLSLGATGSNQSQRTALHNLFRGVMDASPGALFVAAAGNEGTNNESNPMYPCATTSVNLLCVASTGDDDSMSSFSNYGSTTVDLGAPGEMILSTGAPGYLMYMSGTSMATPMVAGAAASLLASDPTATVAELRAALLVSGDAEGSLSGKTVTGRRLNLAQALIALQDPPIFDDVDVSNTHYANIQTIYPDITSGCSSDPRRYCPAANVTRGQMAVFLIRAMGLEDTLQPYQGLFEDVPGSRADARYIERLYGEGITSGCRSEPLRYCPSASVTRAQMAVFLIRGIQHLGDLSTYAGYFSDVPAGHPMASFIEHLSDHEVTVGCGGGRYCPSNAVTRAQMATFLVRAFDLT